MSLFFEEIEFIKFFIPCIFIWSDCERKSVEAVLDIPGHFFGSLKLTWLQMPFTWWMCRLSLNFSFVTPVTWFVCFNFANAAQSISIFICAIPYERTFMLNWGKIKRSESHHFVNQCNKCLDFLKISNQCGTFLLRHYNSVEYDDVALTVICANLFENTFKTQFIFGKLNYSRIGGEILMGNHVASGENCVGRFCTHSFSFLIAWTDWLPDGRMNNSGSLSDWTRIISTWFCPFVASRERFLPL